MTLPLPLYAKIKDRYCVAYFGNRDEVIQKLIKARPSIEKELPGIHVYICCNNEKSDLLKDVPNSFLRSELEIKRNEVVYFRELEDTADPVAELLEESSIPFLP